MLISLLEVTSILEILVGIWISQLPIIPLRHINSLNLFRLWMVIRFAKIVKALTRPISGKVLDLFVSGKRKGTRPKHFKLGKKRRTLNGAKLSKKHNCSHENCFKNSPIKSLSQLNSYAQLKFKMFPCVRALFVSHAT